MPSPSFVSPLQPGDDAPSFGCLIGGSTTPPEPAQSINDPRESFTDVEIVTIDSTLSIFEEAEAESQLTIRGEAKKLISERLQERNRLRVLLAKAETELAKLLKKTPEEIAALRY